MFCFDRKKLSFDKIEMFKIYRNKIIMSPIGCVQVSKYGILFSKNINTSTCMMSAHILNMVTLP